MWYNSPFNTEIIKFIQSFSSPLLDKFFIYVTMMGEEGFFMIAAVLIYWCIDKNFGYRMGFAYLTNALINGGIKEALKVPRPIGEPGIRSLRTETAGGYSFPSGHSQSAASFWASVMFHVKQKWIYIACSIPVILVGISRLYLGVHRPVDVAAGISIGVLWVLICNYMFHTAEKTGKKTIFLAIIIPMVVIMFIIKNSDYYKVAGTALAFYIGYIIEPEYINFEVNAPYGIQVIKLLIGITIMLGIRVILKSLLPQILISDFVRYFLMGVWVTIGAPYIFKKCFSNIPRNLDRNI